MCFLGGVDGKNAIFGDKGIFLRGVSPEKKIKKN
jgi:hypothetical protein